MKGKRLPEERQPDCCRTKERDPEEDRDLICRLNRIEGQIRGLKRMVEEKAYCPDILTQAQAASSALNAFQRVLLENHLKTCVVDDIKADKEGTVEDLTNLLRRLMR